jgi:uncharacterized membrane protein
LLTGFLLAIDEAACSLRDLIAAALSGFVFSLVPLWLLIAPFAQTLTVFCSRRRLLGETSDLARKKLHVLLLLSDKAHVPVPDLPAQTGR